MMLTVKKVVTINFFRLINKMLICMEFLQMSLPQNVPSGTGQGEIAVFTG